MNTKKYICACLVVLITIGLFAGCNGSTPESSAPEALSSVEESIAPASSEAPAPPASESYLFTDDAGREVEIPNVITRIAPSGPMAQTTLLTLVPESLVALSSGFDSTQQHFFEAAILHLPELGNLYADTLNMESILATDPQVIIDIGEVKGTTAEDMDRIQAQTEIPTIFIHMELDNMAAAYRKLGEIVGNPDQAEGIATYIEETLAETAEKAATIPAEDRIRVYYGGEDGLTAYVDGTVHSDIIALAGGDNVAKIESTVRAGGAEISLEQVLLWEPDVMIFVPNTVYDTIAETPGWSELKAISTDRYYEGPQGPYNWMGRPPSVSRIIGIKWAGNLLYPSVFDYDMIEETKTFFQLFYHYDITEEETREILKNSTYRVY